jgi:long-chain acyl-CoA synthetase
MFHSNPIRRALPLNLPPENSPEKLPEEPIPLGYTLPQLLDLACDRSPNDCAFNHWYKSGWRSWSNQDLRSAAEDLALGLGQVGLVRGDRVALMMYSDVNFCIADFGCLLAGLVNVPIYLGEAPTNVLFMLQHSGAKALIVSDLKLLCQVLPCLREIPDLQTLIVVEQSMPVATQPQPPLQPPPQPQLEISVPSCPAVSPTEAPCIPTPRSTTVTWPEGIRILSWREVQAQGAKVLISAGRIQRIQQLKRSIAPRDLATIVYITGATGQFQGISPLNPPLRA